MDEFKDVSEDKDKIQLEQFTEWVITTGWFRKREIYALFRINHIVKTYDLEVRGEDRLETNKVFRKLTKYLERDIDVLRETKGSPKRA